MMNTFSLTPDAVERVRTFVSNATEHVIERITPALRDYEATEGLTDRRFANYTGKDIRLLSGFSISNKVSDSVSKLANSRWLINRVSLFQLIDRTFENKVLGEKVKDAIELLVSLCDSEKTGNAEGIVKFTLALREFTVRNGFFKRCDYCKNCAINGGQLYRTYTCEAAVVGCPTTEPCEKFVSRPIDGGESK